MASNVFDTLKDAMGAAGSGGRGIFPLDWTTAIDLIKLAKTI
jgi:hypothetical protein